MMIDRKFLDVLVCPTTKQPMHVADAEILTRLNARIVQETVTNRVGQPITHPLEAGLICQEGSYLYPIKQGIPVLLPNAAIPLNE